MIEENIKPEQTLEMVGQFHLHFPSRVSSKRPIGNVWSKQEIEKRKKVTEDTWLRWAVVERIPAHKDMKWQVGNYQHHIETCKNNLTTPGKSGFAMSSRQVNFFYESSSIKSPFNYILSFSDINICL